MKKQFVIRPIIDGKWSLEEFATEKKCGIFSTVDEAKAAADNLSREPIYYTPGGKL